MMDLQRYEELTGTKVSEAQIPMTMARIESATAHVNALCGGQFTQEDGTIVMPPDVELGVALLVKATFSKSGNVASYSLGGMSKSFFQGGEYSSASEYWQPYLKKVLFF